MVVRPSCKSGLTIKGRYLDIEVSFGVYLLHGHAEWMVDELVGGGTRWSTIAVKIAVTLALAQVANSLIEKPCRAWLRKAGDRFMSCLSRYAKK